MPLPVNRAAGQTITAADINAIAAAVNLAALTPMAYTAPSGAWNMPTHVVGSGAGAPASGTVYWTPMNVGPQDLPLQALGVNCTTAYAGTSATLTLGIYKDDGTGGMPLLTSAGLVVSGATGALTTTGTKQYTFTATLTPGRYWLASLLVATGQTTAAQFQCVSTSTNLWLPGTATLGGLSKALAVASQTVLPTSAVTMAYTNSTVAPTVHFRTA